MKKRTPTKGMLLLAASMVVMSLPLGLWSERLVFTTSYPSPVGIYHQILTTGGIAAAPLDTILARDAGNVGIGTINPQAKLQVAGSLAVSGNVGVGTTNPAAKLEVVGGAIQATGGLIVQRCSNSGPSNPASGQIWIGGVAGAPNCP